MYSVAIRELKNNPAAMTKHLEKGDAVFVTKHGKPIGITLPFSEKMLEMGMLKAVALEQYKQGLVSLGKMAEMMGITKPDAVKLLNDLHIDWLGYDEKEIEKQIEVLGRS
jgi:predicted HTH domain antitoxin